jgi:hypothetical protein
LSPFAVNTAERDAINAAMKSQYRTVAVGFDGTKQNTIWIGLCRW